MSQNTPPQRPNQLNMWNYTQPPPGYSNGPMSPTIVVHRPEMASPVDPYPMHRHSYHGGMGMELPSEAGMSSQAPQGIPTRSRVSSFHDPRRNNEVRFRNNVLRAQRSLEHDPSSCQRKRFSGSYSFALSSLPELGEKMNSTDSLHTIHRRKDEKAIDHTMQQGPELQESPRNGSMQSLNSTTSNGKDSHQTIIPPSQQQQQHAPHMMPPPGGMPIEGRVLVDPATGQHYIVPSQTNAQYYYPPMYYPAPHGQHPSPYYPYPPPHAGGRPDKLQRSKGYMPPGSQTTTPTGYAMPMSPYGAPPPQPRYQATPPTYRHPPFIAPPSSVPSNEDLSRRDSAEPPERRFGDDHPPPSPSFSTKSMQMHPVPPGATSFAQHYNVSRQPRASPPQHQPEDPETRDHFRRDSTRSSGGGEFNRQGSGEFNRSTEAFNRHPNSGRGSQTSLDRQMYAVPPPQQTHWWNRAPPPPVTHLTSGRMDGDAMTDVESSSRKPRHSPPLTSCASDNEAVRRAVTVQQDQAPPPPRPAPKAVRMDFDFNQTLPEEEELNRPKPKPANHVPPTSFTVTFDSEPGSEKMSLQDAARKSGTGRRLLGRRSVAPQPTSSGPAASARGDSNKRETLGPRESQRETQSARPPQDTAANKHYLLNKLLQGPLSSSGPSALSPEDAPQLNGKRDADAVSEAGTFVIGAGQSKTAMMTSRVIGDSDSESDSSSSSSSVSSSRTNSPGRTPTSATSPSAISPRFTTSNPGPETPGSDSSSVLLKELIALKRAQHMPRPQPHPTQPPRTARATSTAPQMTTGRPCSAAGSAPPAPSRGRQSLGQTPSNRQVYAQQRSAAPNNPNFRRGDGGRFSMRTGPAGPSQPSPQMAKKPPFRAGNTGVRPASNNAEIQREQERTAWLRRKEYNPMKAAQEAKKAQQQKQRGDNFMSNRSISFHVGPSKPPPRRSEGSELSRNKSEESLAYEGASTASQRVIAEYSREVVKDINRLTERSKKGDKKELSGLARAVDMLSTKCKKSIELIRSQNKGCLSVSVEDLLSLASEPPKENESLSDQLDRLSDAFDAVQRYLEQYSLDGRMSPVMDDDDATPHEDIPDAASMVSGFSTISLRTNKPRPFANSYGSASLAGTQDYGAQRAQRTAAYRSRILSQQSNGEVRPGKNN